MLYKEPIQICGRIIQNRIVMPPMATGKAVDGAPGEEMVEYYRQRAKGTGLVIVEHEYVMLQGMAHPGQLSMAEDPVIPAYRKLTNAIHGEGSAVIAQLNHAGVKAMDTGMPPAGPSAMPAKDCTAEAMDRDQIRAVIEAFTAAAVRAKEAGFDGAELHSAHGYLLNQFYSPLTNHRDDEYSAKSMADRTRLHCEIIRTVREAVGEYFIIAIRFGACDYAEGGSRIEDIPEAVRAFEAAGADLIDISGGTTGFMRPGHTEPGYLKDLSIAAKSAVSVPVILTGGVAAASEMEALLQEGAADLIGVGRALLKDPAWSEKAMSEG
jgi:2,4-dienoyl-CoA reductase-like NADH-dependent reductase (Old Yellow Enzyme family)